MEKKVREKRVPTEYKTTQEEYWEVTNAYGQSITYATQEIAAKAEDFLSNYTRKSESLEIGSYSDGEINLVTYFLKYPIEELTGEYGTSILPSSFMIPDNHKLKGRTGEVKTLEINYYDVGSDLIVIDEEIKEQLLKFLTNGQD